MSQENHAAAASQIASATSKLGARAVFARFSHAASAALRVRHANNSELLPPREGESLPVHVTTMERAFSDFAGARMDQEEKDGAAFTAGAYTRPLPSSTCAVQGH
jgi:hypothetical protein